MPEENQAPEHHEEYEAVAEDHKLRNLLLGIAIVYVIASLYFIFETRGRVEKLEDAQITAAADRDKLTKRLGTTEDSLKQSQDTAQVLSSKLGMTEKEIKTRAAQLQKEQEAAEQRLQEQQKQQIGQVSGEVAGVKTELGGAKTDIAATRTDLEATKKKLESAIGDLGVQSGLIAHTRDELEYLKHRGDRNIFEFTLKKGTRPTPVSTVSLQLKKVDAKKGKYSLNVVADDRTIEKKDRTVNEPLQFYTGRDRMLYEVVVMNANKDQISGYLSTPKNAPQPAVVQQ